MTEILSEDLIIDYGDGKAAVEITPSDTLSDVRRLVLEEFDDDMFPDGDRWGFWIDGIRITSKQEERKIAWNYLTANKTVCMQSIPQRQLPEVSSPLPKRAKAAVDNTISFGSTLTSSLTRTSSNTRSESKTLTLKVARIAVGARVLDFDCGIIFAKASLILRGNDANVSVQYNHITKIDFADDFDSVKELKFFLGQADNPDVPSFLSLRVIPTKVNDLGRFPNKYNNRTKGNKNKYIVVQFQSDADLKKLLQRMKQEGNPFVCDDARLLEASEAREYIGSLMPSGTV